MPKVSDEHRAAMRRRIQEAALACVRRKGLANTSMNDVIRESGLSAGAIYGYFRSKDELITSVAADLITDRFELLADLERRSAIPHPLEAVAELVLTIPAALAEDGVLLQLWGMAPVDDDIAASAGGWLRQFTGRMTTYTATWLRSCGVAAETAEREAIALAPAMIGAAQGYFVRGALAGPAELETYRDSLRALARLTTPATPGNTSGCSAARA